MSPETFERLSLAGRIAVVTGGTQGLGEAIAGLFADRGAAGLVIAGRNRENGARVKAELEAKGAKCVYVPADLAKLADVRAVTGAAEAAFGRIDVLVNAAAITDRGTIWDTSPALFERMFAINVRAPFFLMQEAALMMRRNKTTGSIVNILSMSAHGGQSFITAYSASKGALLTLTRNVAFSVMRHGIPFGRLVKAGEIARAAAYLASEESGLMTGAIIDFDQSVLGAYEAAPLPPPIA